MGSFKRSINNNTSFFPREILKQLRNKTQGTTRQRRQWKLTGGCGFTSMASRAELANGFLCPRSELCDQEPEHMHLSAITASHGCAAGEENGSLMAAALPALSSLMLPNQETLASTDQITCFHCRNSILKGVAPCATRRQGEKRLLPQTVKSKRNRRSGAHSGFFLQFSLLIAFHLSFNYICTILTDNQG